MLPTAQTCIGPSRLLTFLHPCGRSQGGTVGDRSGEDVQHLKAAIIQPAALMGLSLIHI